MQYGWKRLWLVMMLSIILPRALLGLGSSLAVQQERDEETQMLNTYPVRQEEPSAVTVLMNADTAIEMVLEEYVRGVVLGEMRASFDPEALKAQAVAARTYALRRVLLADRHPQGAVCTDPGCCQAWLSDDDYTSSRGTWREWRKIAQAVADTEGIIVIYEGVPAETTYFSCSGGRTEAAVDVWGTEIPYLQSVSSPGEEWASVYSAEYTFAPEEFSACLGISPSGDVRNWFGDMTYTQGGAVAEMVICEKSYKGTALRQMLGLNSTAFTVWVQENTIHISTRGKGHRVGMSQYGADALAKMGYRYDEILQRYYPGTVIDKMGDIG